VICENKAVPHEHLSKAVDSAPFKDWIRVISSLFSKRYSLHAENGCTEERIHNPENYHPGIQSPLQNRIYFIKSVDMFGPKVGFIKFKSIITDHNSNVPWRTVFMRGGSVAILVYPHDEVVLTGVGDSGVRWATICCFGETDEVIFIRAFHDLMACKCTNRSISVSFHTCRYYYQLSSCR
jgi:hypothetical protein